METYNRRRLWRKNGATQKAADPVNGAGGIPFVKSSGSFGFPAARTASGKPVSTVALIR